MEGDSGAVSAWREATPRVTDKGIVLNARHGQSFHAFLHVHVLPPTLPAHTLANTNLLLVLSNCRSREHLQGTEDFWPVVVAIKEEPWSPREWCELASQP